MAASTTSPARPGRCTHKDFEQRGEIALPVLKDHEPRGTIRKSKSGRRRAVVLAAVQILLIAHILLWYFGAFGGQTTTPIEPSESMEFVKHGIVNVGLIFFAVALLSTLVLGRWFCGWGCHVVMLQDLCAWMMKKIGIRPRPFRSRLLLYVPLLLALYMFVWPAAFRFGRWVAYENGWVKTQIQPWQVSTHYTTGDFWKTFPGLMIAVPFLLICGFGTVYFLGSKGFCTYGCPYGGFFAPLDKLAVGKIRVTEDCEQCGHCTAVCTSNVRVHDEVREYGMVVDPGCMKCMDCVSVCPNDALYYGFGLPTVLAGPAKNAPPKRLLDLGWPEEIALAIVFAGAFFAMRGELFSLPLLFSAGTAGVTTFMVWKLCRIIREKNVNLHRFRFRAAGAVRPSGWIFAAITVLVLVFTAHVGAVNAAAFVAGRHDDQVTLPPQFVYGLDAVEPDAPTKEHAQRGIEWYGRTASLMPAWGPYEPWLRHVAIRSAWLHSVIRDFGGAERVLRDAIQSEESRDAPGDPDRNQSRLAEREVLYTSLGQVIRAGRGFQNAIEFYETTVARHPGYDMMLGDYIAWLYSIEAAQEHPAVQMVHDLAKRSLDSNGRSQQRCLNLARALWLAGKPVDAIEFSRPILEVEETYTTMLDDFAGQCTRSGQVEAAVDVCRTRLERFPDNLHTMRWLSLLELQSGRIEEGVALIRRTLQIDPKNANAYFFLSSGLSMKGDLDGALDAARQGLALIPEHPGLNQMMCELLGQMGRHEEATAYCNKAATLRGLPPPGIAAPQ